MQRPIVPTSECNISCYMNHTYYLKKPQGSQSFFNVDIHKSISNICHDIRCCVAAVITYRTFFWLVTTCLAAVLPALQRVTQGYISYSMYLALQQCQKQVTPLDVPAWRVCFGSLALHLRCVSTTSRSNIIWWESTCDLTLLSITSQTILLLKYSIGLQLIPSSTYSS